jgi:hypothetical protein
MLVQLCTTGHFELQVPASGECPLLTLPPDLISPPSFRTAFVATGAGLRFCWGAKSGNQLGIVMMGFRVRVLNNPHGSTARWVGVTSDVPCTDERAGGWVGTRAEADLLRKEYDSHHSKLTELQEVKRKLDDKLKADYGPDAAFLALHDKCVEIKVNQYTYEVCPFASSTQKEGCVRPPALALSDRVACELGPPPPALGKPLWDARLMGARREELSGGGG